MDLLQVLFERKAFSQRQFEEIDRLLARHFSYRIGDIGPLNHLPVGHHSRLHQRVEQLPDVPRPRVLTHKFHCGTGNPFVLVAGLLSLEVLVDPLHESTDDGRDVLPPLPEWGQLDGDHSQPVVEVRPEAVLRDGT